MAELNLDSLWMTKADFVDFRDISANVKEEKLNIFIREAQFMDVKVFLGATLYGNMQDDWNEGNQEFDEALFNNLWFGEGNFNGYMNAGIYFTYSRFLLQQQVNVSRFGVESVQNEISEDISNAQIRSKTNDARKVGLKYQQETGLYLEDNASDYPDFEQNTVKQNKTAFGFFKL